MNDSQDISLLVNQQLDNIRHFLQEDGGDIEFVRYEPDYKIVVIRFTGNCHDCPLNIFTLQAGIMSYLKQQLPDLVKRVEKVN
jgi:NFU1 iron-sulfur cluster scaffold homolog, mitochondrial